MKTILVLLFCIYPAISFASKLELIAKWDEQSGPGGREHSASWIHKDKYYVVGGYGFTPFQGVDDHSLWRFDLVTKKWKMLPTIGNPASTSLRSYPLYNENGVIILSDSPIEFGRRKISMLHTLKVVDGVGIWQRIDIPLINQDNLDFVRRRSNLSSLIYNKNDNAYYSTCNITSCDTYKITIQENSAKIEKIVINGESPDGRIAYSYGFSEKENSIVIASGQMIKDGESDFSRDIWILNITTKKWEKIPNIMTKRRNPCFSFHEKKQDLLIWGGTNDGTNSLKEAQIFNLKQKSLKNIYTEQLDGNNRSSCFATYHNDYGIIAGFGNTVLDNQAKVFMDLWGYK